MMSLQLFVMRLISIDSKVKQRQQRNSNERQLRVALSYKNIPQSISSIIQRTSFDSCRQIYPQIDCQLQIHLFAKYGRREFGAYETMGYQHAKFGFNVDTIPVC